jgi:glycosyltransferase involved in cell wall biosynthesis
VTVPPVRVLIDASALTDDSSQRGIGRYLRGLLEGLGASSDVSVLALCRPAAPLPDGIERLTAYRFAPGRFRSAERELLLPWDLRRRPVDVVHSAALDPPRSCPVPWVQTIQDVIPLVFDDPELAVERRRWERQAPRLRRAQTIVVPSRHTADTAIAALDLDPRRVVIIPHGVDSRFAPPQDRRPAGQPYLLFVSEYSRRKGYPEAFSVIGALSARGYAHQLRVTGRIAPWVQSTVEALVAAAPAPERIALMGFVDDLVSEYQNADVFISTSRYEGFGFPALEAMACGTPVVGFANSAVTEVVGDAGILVPDGDTVAMAAAVRRVLDDPSLRADLAGRGIERARDFTWARSAADHADAFRQAMSSANLR